MAKKNLTALLYRPRATCHADLSALCLPTEYVNSQASVSNNEMSEFKKSFQSVSMLHACVGVLQHLTEFEFELTYRQALQEFLKETVNQLKNVESSLVGVFYQNVNVHKYDPNINDGNVEDLNTEKIFDVQVLDGAKQEEEGPKYEVNEKLCDLQVMPMVSGFDEIAGLQLPKRLLTTAVIMPYKQPQLYENMRPMNCVLLYGPPGTGKTRLAHALAAEIHADFFCISAGDILNKYIGESEAMLKNVFSAIKDSPVPVVLFFDEIDGICQRRTEQDQSYSRRLKTELMIHLTSLERMRHSTFICATNCPWDLDPAILRRFQQKIFVPLPNEQERIELLHFYTKNTNLESTSVMWHQIIQQTEGFSASDIGNLVNFALHQPLNELQNVKVWRIINNCQYTPIVDSEFVENVICCDLKHLPNNSVVARKVMIHDLIRALDHVKRSICEEDNKKFLQYSKTL